MMTIFVAVFLAIYLIGFLLAFGIILGNSRENDSTFEMISIAIIAGIFSWVVVGIFLTGKK